MTETAFWKQPAAALLAELAATDSGLTSQEAALRLLRHGRNDVTAPKRAPPWLRFTGRLANPLVIILLLASALSAATGDVASFVIIAGIVLLSVVFPARSIAYISDTTFIKVIRIRAQPQMRSTRSACICLRSKQSQ